MTMRHVILELAHTKKLESYGMAVMSGEETALDLGVSPKVDLLTYDESFAAVTMPHLFTRDHPEGELFDTMAGFSFDARPEASTYLVRGTVEEEALPQFEEEIQRKRSVVAFYSDTAIQPTIVCPGSAPVGDDSTVESLLCTPKLHRNGMDGKGVMVAVVDTGVNINYLNSQGKTPAFNQALSWAWDPAQVTPGSAPVDHGTMCAFDVCITAPRCTILDIALLHPVTVGPGGKVMESLLSDAIRAYRHLLDVMSAPRRPGEHRSLVVNNSWGMFHPSWDFPVGHVGNYSDNPNHPFNRIVAVLERAGADILFAAGNCGADCPDGRCMGVTTQAIYGANSSPYVTCVAGVDTTKARVGYSSIGPGRLEKRKPDICGYTHFSGSGVYTADGGTSAACPVTAGVVAAIRSKRPYNPGDSQTSPAAMRNLLTSTAEDLGTTGYDYQYGYGVVDPCKIADKVLPPKPPPICQRYPWICDPSWWRRVLRKPWPGPLSPSAARVDESGIASPFALGSEEPIQPGDIQDLLSQVESGVLGEDLSPEQLAYQIGYWLGRQEAADSDLNPSGETDQ
jgi:hypothetical protein